MTPMKKLPPEPEKKKKHLHTFFLKPGILATSSLKDKIFMCKDPECWFYIKGVMLVGKKAACPKCRNEFILTRDMLRRRVPHCEDCTRGEKSREKQEQFEVIEARIKTLFGLND